MREVLVDTPNVGFRVWADDLARWIYSVSSFADPPEYFATVPPPAVPKFDSTTNFDS